MTDNSRFNYQDLYMLVIKALITQAKQSLWEGWKVPQGIREPHRRDRTRRKETTKANKGQYKPKHNLRLKVKLELESHQKTTEESRKCRHHVGRRMAITSACGPQLPDPPKRHVTFKCRRKQPKKGPGRTHAARGPPRADRTEPN